MKVEVEMGSYIYLYNDNAEQSNKVDGEKCKKIGTQHDLSANNRGIWSVVMIRSHVATDLNTKKQT